MGNALSGGATKSILEFIKTHDGDITCGDIRRAYPNINKNSIHSAFTTLESRGILTRTGRLMEDWRGESHR